MKFRIPNPAISGLWDYFMSGTDLCAIRNKYGVLKRLLTKMLVKKIQTLKKKLNI